MGKRGRPPKRKIVPDTTKKAAQCYTILTSDEEVNNKEESLRLPSPTQRRGAGNARGGTIIITPPDRTASLTNNIEKKTPLARNNGTKKKIILNGLNKKDETSGDSDATEVYVQVFYLRLFYCETFLRNFGFYERD